MQYGTLERLCVVQQEVADFERAIFCIHGGAWRDPANTFADFDVLTSHLVSRTNDLQMYSGDYLLSPEEKHPSHLIDVFMSILYVIHSAPESCRIALLGHSVGATLCLQVMSFPEIAQQFKDYVVQFDRYKPTMVMYGFDADIHICDLNPLWESVVERIDALFLVDGIYDVTSMLEEYPLYDFFVKDAFCGDDWKYCTPLNMDSSQVFEKRKIYIVHSTKDELLSLNQPKQFEKWLKSRGVASETHYCDMGMHNDVYQSEELARYVFQAKW